MKLLIALLITPCLLFAQKNISLVVPYPAGGPLDSAARSLAAKLTADGPIVVDNKVGAGGNIGATYVAKANNDGRTLLIGAVATHAINPHLYKDMPYDALRDFTPVALLAQVPNVLVMASDKAKSLNINNAKEFLTRYKTEASKWNFASGGNGSAGHLAGILLGQQLGVAATHIPYAGAAPALQSLLAGTTDFMFDNLASASAQIKAGKVIAFAVTSQARSAYLPDLPTVTELGLPELSVHTWFGVFAPKGYVDAAKLNIAINTALASPELSDKWQALLLSKPSNPNTPESFKSFLEHEHRFYQKLIKTANITLD